MNKQKKTRKLSIEKKVLLAVVLLGLISSCFMGVLVYSTVSDDMLDSSRENTRCIAVAAAKIINGDLHDELEPGDEDTQVYQSYLESLRKCKNETGVLYMYTLKPLNKEFVQFVVDTDESEMQGLIGDEYEISDMMVEALAGKDVVSEEPTYDEYGEYFSAFAPIFNEAGKVVAIVGVDLELSVVDGNLSVLRNIIILIAGVSFVISVVIGLILSKSIGRNLNTVNMKINEVVYSDGDLTKLIKVSSGDELELMADSLNAFLSRLHDIVTQIVSAGENINDSQEKISSQMKEAVEGITTVSANMEEMTAGMEMTTASANVIHNSIGDVGQLVEQIYEDSAQGAKKAEKVSETAIALKLDAVKSEENVKTLLQEINVELESEIKKSKKVERISSLSDEIIKIANRTNILALNASIESARAGEAGKSFAVVASQVAELASNSTRAAKEIGEVSNIAIEVVEGLSESISKVMQFIEEVILMDYKKLAYTGEEYNKDADSFHEILSGFKQRAAGLESTIDEIKRELGIVVETIDTNTHCIGDIAGVVGELNNSMTSIEKASNNNSSVVSALNQAVGHFKI